MASGKGDQGPTEANRRRWPATVMWVMLVAVMLWLLNAGLPAWYAHVARPCNATACIFFQLPEATARALAESGVPLHVYAAHLSAILLLDTLVYLIASVVIFLQRAQSRMAVFVSFMLLFAPLTVFFTVPEEVVVTQPLWRIPVRLLHAAGMWSLLVFNYTFPDGRFVPRWTRGLAWLAAPVFGALFLSVSLSELVAPITFQQRLMALTLFASIGAGVAFQAYRYRHHANAIERQQMKWVASGFTVFVAAGITMVLAFILFPRLREPGLLNGIYFLFGGTVIGLLQLFFVLSFAIAILRYRLWDIDLIIRRTLIYTLLTATLGLVYLASVVLLQGLLRRLFGQESSVAVVISTLLIAAMFIPLRRRIQDTINRRFYRRKYDAQKALEAFSRSARDEVELKALAGELIRVVEETMQPTFCALWLQSVEDGRRLEPKA